MSRMFLVGAISVSLLVNSAFGQEAARSYKLGSLVIDAPWIRATPAGAQVAGGYLKITNTGQEPDRLIGGSLPVAAYVEGP